MTTKKLNNKNIPVIIPPLGFTFIEEVICRCITPLHRNHLSFLKTTDIKILINLSGEPIYDIDYLIERENYQVHDLFENNESPLSLSIIGLEDWVKKSLELIITLSSQGTILLIGNEDTCIDCLLIGCLRKVQEWALVPIINEFRINTYQRRIFDLEQFIEFFNEDLINLTNDIPEFLATHFLLKEEERKLLERNEVNNNNDDDNDTSNISEQNQIDSTLNKLFFSSIQLTLLPGNKYNPEITLCHDKDDDD